MSRRRRSGPSPRRSGAIPAGCASPSPTSRPMATPSIPKSRRRCGMSPACWPDSAIMSRNARRALAADPAVVMATIVGANTALNVRAAEQRFGREMTDQRFRDTDAGERPQRAEHECDRLCRSAAQRLPDFARRWPTFFETCDVFLCPTLCSPPLRIGELNSMSQDLSHIAPILRRYMPATTMFNMSGQPAMSVPLAWNSGRDCRSA